MRIASFNINSINGRLANLLHWLEVSSPDVACLQEIKCTNAAFPRKALEAAGYSAIWCASIATSAACRTRATMHQRGSRSATEPQARARVMRRRARLVRPAASKTARRAFTREPFPKRSPPPRRQPRQPLEWRLPDRPLPLPLNLVTGRNARRDQADRRSLQPLQRRTRGIARGGLRRLQSEVSSVGLSSKRARWRMLRRPISSSACGACCRRREDAAQRMRGEVALKSAVTP
jgi:hypothetical protein